MTKEMKLKEYLIKYRFLQNFHFCKFAGVNYLRLKHFAAGRRKLRLSEIERLLMLYKKQVRLINNFKRV